MRKYFFIGAALFGLILSIILFNEKIPSLLALLICVVYSRFAYLDFKGKLD